MANIIFDGKTYTDAKAVKFSESPNNMFYDTGISSSEAASASDIKSGKKAWVNGNLVEGIHEDVSANTKDKNIIANGTYYAADDDCVGYKKVTVNVQQSQTDFNPQAVKNVTIGEASGIIEPSPPYTHMTRVDFSVSSNVDANIKPENIREGIPILGITGIYTGSARSIDALYFRNNRYSVAYGNENIKVYYSNPNVNGDNYYSKIRFSLRRKSKTGSTWNTYSSYVTTAWDADLGCVVFSHKYGTTRNYLYEVTCKDIETIDGDGNYTTLFVLTTTKTPQDYIDESDQDYWHKCSVVDGYNYTVDDASMDNTPNFGDKYDITGTFTPMASQNVAGGHIDVNTGGYPRCVIVWAEDEDLNVVDEGAPFRLAVFAVSTTPAGGDKVHSAFTYKASTAGNGQTQTQTYYSAGYIYNDAYKDVDATGMSNMITVCDGFVRFKTYGKYCFRVGKAYRYHIYM